MNWTAILALLAVDTVRQRDPVGAIVFIALFELLAFGLFLWLAFASANNAHRYADEARRDAREANLREADSLNRLGTALADNLSLRVELGNEKRLHRNLLVRQSRRQSRTGQRAGETDHG